jgi:hypothetical protein
VFFFLFAKIVTKTNFNCCTEAKTSRNSKLKKQPAIRCKEKTGKLCRSIRDCLLISTTLHKLEIQGIPLNLKELSILAKVCFLNVLFIVILTFFCLGIKSK